MIGATHCHITKHFGRRAVTSPLRITRPDYVNYFYEFRFTSYPLRLSNIFSLRVCTQMHNIAGAFPIRFPFASLANRKQESRKMSFPRRREIKEGKNQGEFSK